MKDPLELPEKQQARPDEPPSATRSEVEGKNPPQWDKAARSGDDTEGLYEALDRSLTTDQRKRLADLEQVLTSNLQAHEMMRSIASPDVTDHDEPCSMPPRYTMAGEMWKLERDIVAFGTAAMQIAAEALMTLSSASVFRARLESYAEQLLEWLLAKVKEEDRRLFSDIPVKDAIRKVVLAYTKRADLEAPPPWRRAPERSEAKSIPADAFRPRPSEIARRERSSEGRNEGAAPLAQPPSPKLESEARPEVCFVEWGSMPGEPTPLRLSHTGFVLANDGITAHDVSIEDFTVGDELWTAEKLARIRRNGEAFMLVSSKAAAQKWNLLGAINHAASVRTADAPDESAYIVRIRARYRDASNVWYRSWADLTYIPNSGPNLGRLRFGPTAIEYLETAHEFEIASPEQAGPVASAASSDREPALQSRAKDELVQTSPALEFLFERLPPDDPNYDLLERSFLKAWADSHGLVADGLAGQVSLSDFVERCANTFEQGTQVHISLKDTVPISERCNEIDRMADGSVAIFFRSIAPESERLGQPEVAAAVEEYSRRIREIAERSKQAILLGALADMPAATPDVGSHGEAAPLPGNSSLERSQVPTNGSPATADEFDAAESNDDEADRFVVAFEEVAANSAAAMAAINRKIKTPTRPVLYQDLESTIWRMWQVRPDDVTVYHVGHALYLLARKSEGGVELDRVSCEAYGIDYDRLMPLIRPSSVVTEDMSAGPKVPRKPAAGTLINAPQTGGAQSPIGTVVPQPDHQNANAAAPSPSKKRGRPASIDVARKEAALTARERRETWKEVAKVLYGSTYPSVQQVKNAPNILKNYKRTRVPLPNNP